MSAHTSTLRGACATLGRCLTTAGGFVRCKAGSAWHGLRRATRRPQRAEVPVEVLVSHWRDRRAVQRTLVAGLRQLRRVADVPSPHTVAIVAHGAAQVGPDGHYLAGCTEVRQRPDGSRVALIRLALEVGRRRLGHDDLLDALAEQWLALVAQLEGGARVLIPLKIDLPGARDEASRPGETTGPPETGSGGDSCDHGPELVRPSSYVGPAIVARTATLVPGGNATPPPNGHATRATDR